MTIIADDPLQLVNGRIVDVENGRYFDPQVSLVIHGGKIVAMPGLPGQPDAYPAAAVIDLQGKTVIPGLFNTHCHLQFMDKGEIRQEQITRNLADCLDRGVTNVRDTLSYDLTENQAWIDRIARGEVQGPRIHQAVHVSPLTGTYAPRQTVKMRFLLSSLAFAVVDYADKRSGVVTFAPDASAQQVRDAVERAIDERGAVAIKLCDQPEHFMSYKPGAAVPTAGQLAAAVDQATRRGLPTTLHNVTLAGFRNGIQAGVGSLAHIPLDGELTPADVRLLLGSQTHVEPTLSVGYYMSYSMKGSPFAGHPEIERLDKIRDETMEAMIAESWLPALQKIKLGQHQALKNGEIKIFGLLNISEPFRFYSKLVPVGGQNLRTLVENGASGRLACGTDAGASVCSPSVVYQELDMFDFVLNRDAPLFTPADALRIATAQSARSMGVADRFGSICPGKVADLVLLDGDPLQDRSVIGKPVQAVFMDGRLVVNRCGLQVARGE